MSEIITWSNTAADNDDAPPDGFPEGMQPSAVNNCAREMMAATARWHKDIEPGLTATGSSGAYVVTPNRTYASLVDRTLIVWKANHTNPAAGATLQIGVLAAKPIKKQFNVDPIAGDIQSGQSFISIYDATNEWWQTFGMPSPLGQVVILEDTGDGVTVNFTLPADPGTELNTLVYVGSVYQRKSTYSVSGTTLTFTEAPPDTIPIEIIVATPAPTAIIGDGTVTTAKLDDGAVTAAKIGAAAVTLGKIGDDAVTIANMEAASRSDIITYDSAGDPTRLAAGSDGFALVSQGAAGDLKYKRRGLGVNYQWNTDSGVYRTTTAVIPLDDTIPQQSTDGLLVASVTVSPEADDDLVIIAEANLYTGGNDHATLALFKDSEEDAIDVSSDFGNGFRSVLIVRRIPSATAGSQTYKLHVGTAGGSILGVNGNTTNRLYGGAMRSSIEVRVRSKIASSI